MLGDIDHSRKPRKLDLFICKPNGTVISKLSEAYGVQYNPRLGNLSEITFNIPYQVDRQHKLIHNKNIDLLKERYLIKATSGLEEEYFIINNISESDSGSETKTAHCWNLGYELNDKKFRSYKRDAINATTALTDALSSSIWAVGEIYPDFDLVHRSFDLSSTTALDFVFRIAETFKGLLQWDTKNRLINLVKPESVGQNKGLKISYGKYLKSIGREVSTDEMVTRLHVFGGENFSINRVNPTGQSYIESFNFFQYPMYREVYDSTNPDHTSKSQHTNPNTGTVYVAMEQSDYMSEGLCHAIIDYDDLVESKKGEFDTYVADKESKQETLTTLENDMSTLETEMWTIEDNLVIAKANGDDTTLLEQEKANKQAEIDTKQTEIDLVNTDIATIDNNIATLQSELAIENNFTADQIKERNMFIIESEWSDENYIDSKMLYTDAQKFFEILKQPQTVINMDIVNFLNVIEEQRNWDKLSLGDTITIQHERLGIDVQAKIIEIQFDYESDGIRLTIANVKDIQTDKEKFIKSLYRSISTSTSVDMNKYKWDLVSEVDATVNDLINNEWDANKQRIIAGTNESVEISRRGILIKNPDDPLNFLIANHSILSITNDGGLTWKHAITPTGIIGDRIVGRVLIGQNLFIENESGKFTFDQNGATIDGASFQLIGGQNGVSIDADTGFKVVKSDNTARTLISATEGIKIQKSTDNGVTWTDSLYVNIDGDLYLNGVYTGTISFDQAQGGTLTLGGVDNGRLVVLNDNGEQIADLDSGMGGFSELYIGELDSPNTPKYSGDNINLYVDPSNGNDNNDGSSWTYPLKTVTVALAKVPKINNGTTTIYVHADRTTMTEDIYIQGFHGSGKINIKFQTIDMNGIIVMEGNTNWIGFDSVNVKSSASYPVFIARTNYCHITSSTINGNSTSTSANVRVVDGSHVILENVDFYNSAYHCILAQNTGMIFVRDCRGKASEYGVVADNSGTVYVRGTYPGGDVGEFLEQYGGFLDTQHKGLVDYGAATPPEPTTQTYTTTWSSNGSASWRPSGWRTDNDYVYQGDYGYGNHKGLWFFDDANMRSTLSGATIKSVKLYATRNSSGGSSSSQQVSIRTHNYDTQPSGEPTVGSIYNYAGFKWGEGKWVTVSNTIGEMLRDNTAKGMSIYESDGSPYMIFAASAKLEITYEK
jgi:phage minor structural protein